MFTLSIPIPGFRRKEKIQHNYVVTRNVLNIFVTVWYI